MKRKLRLGILFGGRSGEHDVSLESAASVLRAIDPARYDVVPIGITREGRWVQGEDLLKHDLAGASSAALAAVFKSGKAVSPPAEPGRQAMIAVASSERHLQRKERAIDVIFPLLHGTFGEDGTVQGLLEMAGIPYVGAGVLGSAAGMDKDLMKRLFRDARLPVVPWILLSRREWKASPAALGRRIEREIGYPAFVKPANLGSSVGISKVHGRREVAPAVDLAARYDRKVIVEKGIDAREIECAVLGNDDPRASVAGEVVPVNEFYDYNAKYIQEGSELIIPARISARQLREVQDFSLRAFKAVDCAGMARVDFLLSRKMGKLFVNEINTIPGFTSISMYPKLWEASGVAYSKLIDRLISLALERRRDRSGTLYSYKPNP